MGRGEGFAGNGEGDQNEWGAEGELSIMFPGFYQHSNILENVRMLGGELGVCPPIPTTVIILKSL